MSGWIGWMEYERIVQEQLERQREKERQQEEERDRKREEERKALEEAQKEMMRIFQENEEKRKK